MSVRGLPTFRVYAQKEARMPRTAGFIALLAWTLALPVGAGAGSTPTYTYRRVILVSWDGVRRDVLLDLLDADPNRPCWKGGTVFPVATGRPSPSGGPGYTCLPTLAGVRPPDAPSGSPAYGPFQIIASHTTDDGETTTQPQHASMLSGLNADDHGLESNVSRTRMRAGATIYERLMDAFDPPRGGRRNGFLFRTQHSAGEKYIGTRTTYWAKRSEALQIATGRGIEDEDRPGPLQHVEESFARWQADAEARGMSAPSFFMFLHFKGPDLHGHVAGDRSRQYRQAIVGSDGRLYRLLEAVRARKWVDVGVLVTTDHGFGGTLHGRGGGRSVFNTWIAAHNVRLTTDHVPLRTPADYCASHKNPDACLTEGPDVPMPDEDVVPNVFVTFVVPTLLDMFGVDWRTSTPPVAGRSLYRP
jgi:hypothetical protein